MRRVEACNDGAETLLGGIPFLVAGNRGCWEPLGIILPESAAVLSRFPEVFHVSDEAVKLVAGEASVEARSKAVAKVLGQLRQEQAVPMLQGWRDEGWPVKATFDSPVELVIERAAGPLFGVRGYGCHVNGFVTRSPVGGSSKSFPSHLWVAKRASTKPTYPGKLDHVVAGGLAHGEAPGENVVKECGEEAGIPPEIAATALAAGIVEYCQVDETGWGVKRDTIFCYDLELPIDFVPKASDGEVESFELWDMKRVVEALVADDEAWKPNVALVIIDMLVRRGFLAPEERGYVDLVRSLRP